MSKFKELYMRNKSYDANPRRKEELYGKWRDDMDHAIYEINQQIKDQRVFSHNIVSLILRGISEPYGNESANWIVKRCVCRK